MAKSILTNSFFKTSGFVYTAVITFFITPFLINKLGNNLYGIWTLVIGLTGYMGLLDFGMRTAIVKYISQYLAVKEYGRMKKIGDSAMTLFVVAGFFSWLTLIVLSFFFETFFNIPAGLSINFPMIMCIIGGDVFFTFLFMVYQGSIAGFQRYDLSVRNGLTAFTLKSILIVVILLNGYGLITLSIVVLLSNLSGYILNYYSFKSISPHVSYSIGYINKKYFDKLWQYSWKSFVTNISDRLIYYSDSIIIGIFLNAESITFYTIASTIIIYVRQLVLSATEVFVPAISAADAENKTEYIQEMVIKCSKLVFFILIPLCSSLLVVGEEFIKLWIGTGYEVSFQVLVILVISQLIVLSQYGITLVLYGTGQHDILAKTNVAAAILNIALSVILVHFYGVIGVALGAAIPLCLLRLIFVLPRVFCLLNLEVGRYLKQVIFPVVLVFVFHFLFLWN